MILSENTEPELAVIRQLMKKTDTLQNARLSFWKKMSAML